MMGGAYMTKILRSVCLDPEIASLAASKIKNVSSFCNEALRLELELIDKKKAKTDKDIIQDLQIKNASLMAEVKRLKEELDKKEDSKDKTMERFF